MRAAVLTSYKEPVDIVEQDAPAVGPRDLLVRVRAASVNPLDWKTQAGMLRMLLPLRLPIVLGNDGSGVVEAVGPEVTRFKIGDEVYARVNKQRLGTYAELVALDESEAGLMPSNLSHVEAASLPLVGLTSWQALIEVSKLRSGQRVLIHAGAGGVGTFAIQLAHALGAYVITTASPKDFAMLRELGADELLDYRSSDFSATLRDVDLVFDTMGGSTLRRSFKTLRRGGRLITIGGIPHRSSLKGFRLSFMLGTLLDLLNLPQFLMARYYGVRYQYLFMHPDGDQLRQIAEKVEAGQIRPILDRIFPLAQTQDALNHVKSGHTKGKVVIEI